MMVKQVLTLPLELPVVQLGPAFARAGPVLPTSAITQRDANITAIFIRLDLTESSCCRIFRTGRAHTAAVPGPACTCHRSTAFGRAASCQRDLLGGLHHA